MGVEVFQNTSVVYNDPESQREYDLAITESKQAKSELQVDIEAGGNKKAKDLIKKGQTWVVANYIDNFDGLDIEVASMLIKRGHIKNVVENLGSFVCDKKLYTLLVNNGQFEEVVEHFYNKGVISGNDAVKQAIKLKGKNDPWYVASLALGGILLKRRRREDVRKEDPLDGDVARYFLGFNKPFIELEYTGCDGIKFLAKRIWMFKGLDKKIAETLINKGYFEYVIKNMGSFDQEGKNYSVNLREQLNYRMAKDIDGKIKPYEEIENGIKNRIESVIKFKNRFENENLEVKRIKHIGDDFHLRGFELTTNKKRPEERMQDYYKPIPLKVHIYPKAKRYLFEIPGLKLFHNINEMLDVVYLIRKLRIRRTNTLGKKSTFISTRGETLYRQVYYEWKNDKLVLKLLSKRDGFDTIYEDINIGNGKLYQLLKNNEAFLNYINTER